MNEYVKLGDFALSLEGLAILRAWRAYPDIALQLVI